MKPTDEQVRKFWEWCGFTFCDDGIAATMPLIDLNNLFKWAVPKLSQDDQYPQIRAITIEPAMCDELMYSCYLLCEILHDDGSLEREEFTGYSEELAHAIFWAIWGIMEAE